MINNNISKTKTEYKFNELYFPTDKHLFIYKQLYNEVKKSFLKNTNDINLEIFIRSIQYNTTRYYNNFYNKYDDCCNQLKDKLEYRIFSFLYDYKTKHIQTTDEFIEMLNIACKKSYKSIHNNTDTILRTCNKYIVKKAQEFKQSECRIDKQKWIVLYYATTHFRNIYKLCINRMFNIMLKHLQVLKTFIKHVYFKVIAFNRAINMILMSKTYNYGLGLKLSMRDCGLELSNS
jgi:hypothetical protein